MKISVLSGRLIGIALLLLLHVVASLQADVRLPKLFGDHMVLQEGMPIPVWGWADPGEQVDVSMGAEKASVTTSPEGKWSVRLGTMKSDGQPLVFRVRGKNTVEFKDVLIGEVWLCSGQSKMEFGLTRAHNGGPEILQANHPLIRLFTVPRTASPHALADVSPAPGANPLMSAWQVCIPETVKKNGAWGGFPAVAYFFAKEIQQQTGKPVGLINAAWGATAAQVWMSPAALSKDPRLAAHLQKYQTITEAKNSIYPWSLSILEERTKTWNESRTNPELKAREAAWKSEVEAAKASGTQALPPLVGLRKPEAPNLSAAAGLLFQGMIAPLKPYAIRGVIWYQGEANDGNGAEYAHLFPALIADWRQQWGQGDFPFLYVQLARFLSPKTGSAPGVERWARVREAQRLALSVPNTAMAVALDLGESHEIHPTNKEEVGRRLALAARHVAYQEDVVYSGPAYESMKVQGAKILVQFTHTGGGLVLGSPWFSQPDGVPEAKEKLLGFEVAGSDGKWIAAQAGIEGNSVSVWSDTMSAPVQVRYGWANDPVCNLFNKEGLPASAFTSQAFP